MRCAQVIRELASPSETERSAEAAEHLAHCAACTAWAERNARLDTVWEATRPPALRDSEWERIWAAVSEAAERGPINQPAPAVAPSRVWRGRLVTGLWVAQAAAILIAVAWFTRLEPPRPPGAGAPVVTSLAPQPRPVEKPAEPIEIDPDQIVMIDLDGASIHVRDIALNDNPNGVDPLFSMYNTVEAIATLQQ